MEYPLQIIQTNLLKAYLTQVPKQLQTNFEALHDAEISTDNFSFYTSVASVYSSKIEGEEIELDSYIKHKKFGIEFLPDYTKKIDDLYNAYTFAKTNALNEQHIAKAHQLLSKHFVAEHQQGKFRKQNMYVSTPDGKIEYVAVSPFEVDSEMQKFYHDLEILLNAELSVGNGRSGRLIEKWFLAVKLGEKAWFVSSEKNYYNQHQTYYNNLRVLGLEYPDLDYSKALPFLLMLPSAVTSHDKL